MSTEDIIKTGADILAAVAKVVLEAVKNNDAERLKQLETAVGQVSQKHKTDEALDAARGRLRKP